MCVRVTLLFLIRLHYTKEIYTRISSAAPGKQIIADVFELLEVTDQKVIDNLTKARWLS